MQQPLLITMSLQRTSSVLILGLCFTVIMPLSAFSFSGGGASSSLSLWVACASNHRSDYESLHSSNENESSMPIHARYTVSVLHRRRLVLESILSSAIVNISPPPAEASPSFLGNADRRQLELCLVAVQRVVYWAKFEVDALITSATEEERKYKYLETRLGAKALLTGKLGGGATGRVYQLASLQLTGCLRDLEWHAAQRKGPQRVSEWCRSFTEGLSSVVEFDGLETLMDSSPRSTLTLSQYNDSKAVYVRRALDELVIPAGNQLLQAFGSEALQTARGYVQQYYASEIYPPPQSTPSELSSVDVPSAAY